MTGTNSQGHLDWRDPSAGGGLVRAALWLLQVVGEGGKFTKGELRAAFPDIAQIDRRVRDLRDYGWIIDTSREDSRLSQAEQRFVKQGLGVWDPKQRKNRTAVRQQDDGPAVAAEELADQAAALPAHDRTRLLAWITMGERPQTPVEEIWDHYKKLPSAGKQQLTLQLARLLGQDAQARDGDA